MKQMFLILIAVSTCITLHALEDPSCPRRDGFYVNSDVTQERLLGYQFCYVKMDVDHHGYSANQPQREWTRIRSKIPKGAIAAQLTAYDRNGRPTKGGEHAYVMNATTVCDDLHVELQYWDAPWQLWIGYLLPGDGIITDSGEPECDAYVYNPPLAR